MGRPALDTEAVERFREEVCEVALRCFAEHGYAAVTLRGIAREVGCSHALTYRYFENKADLFLQTRRMALSRFIAYQRERLEPISDPRRAVEEGARSYVDFAIEEPQLFRVLFDLNQPPVRGDRKLADCHRQAFRLLQRVVRRAVDEGLVDGDPAELTRLLWSAIHGVASLHLTGQLTREKTAQNLAMNMARTLLNGLAPES